MKKEYVGFSYKKYRKHCFPTRELILSAWLTEASLNMIYSWRGVGKTHVALGIAYAVATGGKFLKWEASKPQGVLYIDGEMPGNILQARLAQIEKNSNKPIPDDNLIIHGVSNQDKQMPDLATIKGQEEVNRWITPETKLIIIDNLSCLVRSGGRENDAESWREVSGWALQKRAQGLSIIFIHHSGKDGAQRGTSKREDILDVVITLKQPHDHEPSQGARIEVHFEKCRHLYGEEVKPFIASLSQNNNTQWKTETLVESNKQKVIQMSKEGFSNTEIVSELGISRQAVHKHLKQSKESVVSTG
jgi:hypothetical protein